MDNSSNDLLSTTKQALLTIRQLKQQLAEAEQGPPGDIAIISMACRFPKSSDTPEKFWKSLVEGQDEVSEIPSDRWELKAFFDEDPEAPGKMYARHGVFLDRIDLMDPEFFGISPREATWVDPQQRMLLETSWEALERACWTPALIGESTGVFVGWMHNDYQNESSDSFLNLNPYIATGAAGSFLPGRLAYYLGLEGPSVAVDTACSSSLVALHLACQSLLRRECNRAIVGGVNAIVAPTTNILTCKLKALSPRGHSRAFDADADGYLRGEGCGVVAIRRLEDAERDGDPILGIIRGSAVGHNGFSSGLTAPNPRAQEKVITQALQRARISPEMVGYLEAHGTGTELGDPIELQAAAAAYGAGRNKTNPLLTGSVKTNIGHLEAASGMAGLIKTLLAFQYDRIPGQLNFETPNPHIPWDQIPIKILTSDTNWPEADRRLAGLSAFGMSGTNAHVILEAPEGHHVRRSTATTNVTSPTPTAEHAPSSGPQLVTLSGKSEEALFDLFNRYRDYFQSHPELNLADVAWTMGTGRSHFDHRAAFVASNADEAGRQLESLQRSGSGDSAATGYRRSRAKVTWQFTGQGSQYLGMAKHLYDAQPIFRESIDQCESWLLESRSESLRSVMFEQEDLLNHTSWTQPAIFAVQMGLVKLLEHWGLAPDLVMGHSVGQYAAACVAGIFSWQDGLQLIAERGRLIGGLPEGGGMLALFAPAKRVEELIQPFPEISLAALNGTHIVVSGPADALSKLDSKLSEQQIRSKRLKTSHAFHSSLMEPILDEFRVFADSFEFHESNIPLVCNVSGDLLPPDSVLDGSYWSRHIRAAVRYADSLQTVIDAGAEVLLEVGPQAVLTNMARSHWTGEQSTLVSCLQPETNNHQSLLGAVGKLYVQGITPNFDALHESEMRQRLLLPTYPFQRRRFWGPAKARAFYANQHTAHPLLGEQSQLADLPKQTRYESHIEPDSPPWLPDHRVMDQSVLPGAAFMEMGIQAAEGVPLQELHFEQPLQPNGRTTLQTIVHRGDEGASRIEIYSSPDQSSEWTRHFHAQLGSPVPASEKSLDREAVLANCPHEMSSEDFYQRMRELGLNYGSQFQTVKSLNYSETEVLAKLNVNGDALGYRISPPLLDGALHCLAVGILHEETDSLFLPIGMASFECYGKADDEIWCRGEWRDNEGALRTADITLFNRDGSILARIEELKVREINRQLLRKMSQSGAPRIIHDLTWQPYRLPAASDQTHQWLVVSAESSVDSNSQPLTSRLCQLMSDGGHQLVEVHLTGGSDSQSDSNGWLSMNLDETSVECWTNLLKQIGEKIPGFRPAGIVWIPGAMSTGELEPAKLDELLQLTRTNVEGFLGLLKALQHAGIRHLDGGFQWITHHGISTTDWQSDTPSMQVDVYQSQFWGLGRVLAAEFPEYRSRLIDLDSTWNDLSEDGLQTLREVLFNETGEGQVAIREGRYLVPRLQETQIPSDESHSIPIKQEASYLITGGLGKLGIAAAEYFAGQGAKHLVLVSRRQPDEPTQQKILQIQESGAQVEICNADLSSAADVAQLMARFGSEFPPLHGILHAAGVLDDGLMIDQNWERFDQVLAPKIRGASLLHHYTASQPLDFFVLYSSAASVLGSPGQSNYAMANAFLDGLTASRRASGLPAISINWGPWEIGMADDKKILKRLSLQGITPLTSADAHKSLASITALEIPQTTIMDVEWSRMRWGPGGETPPLLEKLTVKKRKSQARDSQLVVKLKQLGENQRRELLLTTIQSELKRILDTPDDPETGRPLIEMGLDSLMAVEFGTQLQTLLGDNFPVAPTMLFEFPTIDAITDHLVTLVGEQAETKKEEKQAVTTSGSASLSSKQIEQDDIAIIGMSCQFPGANNIREFWDNLLNGVDSVREIPEDRWDVEKFYSPEPEPGKMYTKEGGFVESIGDFDADFFKISEQEACWIDPQHRLMLENSWNALEDAGIAVDSIADPNVGVFMGIMSQDYAFLPSLEDREVIEAFAGGGLAHSAGVGRISHMFGFEGPSVSVDTASSSSLVAVIQAAQSLRDGDCHLALAGGVNAILAPGNSLLMSRAGMLSPDGRCKSFSSSADGFGRGEGCGIIVLKRLQDAKRDNDRVMAVIRGGAIAHNGVSGGLTTPNTRSQVKIISQALKQAGMAPSEVQYLEAHGTGTEYGDPMELTAAASVFGKGRKHPLLVGSVKANISHLEAAGGISGIIKTVLAIRHGVLPRQLHFDSPSPHIPWERLPLKMVTEQTAWPETKQRIAGVTALGLSGTNAHVVLSSFEQEAEPYRSDAETPQTLVLSAKNETALQSLAKQYAETLTNDPSITLLNFCATIATGRQHFEHRAAAVLKTREQAIKTLKTLAGEIQPENGHHRGSNLQVGKGAKNPNLSWVFGPTFDCSSPFRELSQKLPLFNETILSIVKMAPGELDFLTHDKEGMRERNSKQHELRTFVMQLALAELWKTWGFDPESLAGFGVGQYTAAVLAGALSQPDALQLVIRRAALRQEFSQILPGSSDDELSADLADALDRFEEFADKLNYFPVNRLLIDSLSAGTVPAHRQLSGNYWRRHCVEFPQIEHCWQHLRELNDGLILNFTEPSELTDNEAVIDCLSRGSGHAERQYEVLAKLYVAGANFTGVFTQQPFQKVSLPTYPFQKRRYWITEMNKYIDHETV